MNKRNKAILEYVMKKRPDCLANVSSMLSLDNANGQAIQLLMFLAFEAGREFQDKTKAELGNPEVYL